MSHSHSNNDDGDELSNALSRMKLETKEEEPGTPTPVQHPESVPQTPQKVQVEPVTPPPRVVQPPLVKEEQDNELEEFTRLFQHKLALTEPTPVRDQTLVVLSPLCYGHVFSRTWLPKRDIATIVERPERIKACSLGIGAAMNELPTKLSLVTSKHRADLRAAHVSKVHGEDWGDRLYKLCAEATNKLARRELEVPDDWHYGDIYLCQGTIDALEGNLGAMEHAVDALFNETKQDRAFVALRPPGHHSHPCEPSGFCLVNNIHIAIQYAAAKFDVTHAVILDFDLHHGDGSQDITCELNFDNQAGPRIGYFSLHDINSFPTEKGYASLENVKNASVCCMGHDMAIWNVHLETYETEEEFDRKYAAQYSVLFQKAREFLAQAQKNDPNFKPMVYLSAGFDASEFEMVSMQRHGVHVPTRFYNMFTRDSLSLANQFGCKVLSLLEGGYSDAALSTGLFSHLSGLTDTPWRWNVDSYIAKEFERGSKARFTLGAAGTWVTEGILLGRTLWPKKSLSAAAAASSSASSTNPSTPAGGPKNHWQGLATTGKQLNNSQAQTTLDVLATPSRVLRDRSKISSTSKR